MVRRLPRSGGRPKGRPLPQSHKDAIAEGTRKRMQSLEERTKVAESVAESWDERREKYGGNGWKRPDGGQLDSVQGPEAGSQSHGIIAHGRAEQGTIGYMGPDCSASQPALGPQQDENGTKGT